MYDGNDDIFSLGLGISLNRSTLSRSLACSRHSLIHIFEFHISMLHTNFPDLTLLNLLPRHRGVSSVSLSYVGIIKEPLTVSHLCKTRFPRSHTPTAPLTAARYLLCSKSKEIQVKESRVPGRTRHETVRHRSGGLGWDGRIRLEGFPWCSR